MKRNGNNRAMMASKTRISEGWRLVRLGDMADVLDARRIPLNAEDRSKMPGEYPYYGANGVIDFIDRWIFDEDDDLVLLAEDGGHFDEFRNRPIAFRVEGKCWVNNHAHVLKATTCTVGGFLFHSLVNKDIRLYINGTTRSKLTQADLLQVEVSLPPLPVQRAIAAVLDAIDDAIEGTEALIAATEQLRDSLLHELLTRGVPGWHTEWKDVPGLGTIPADWEVVSMGEVYEVQLGKMLSPKAKQGANPKPYLTNRNVRWGGFDLADLPTMDFDEREIKKFQLRQGDLMVCEGGDTGRAAVWEEPIVDCYYQKALHRLRPKGNTEIPKFMLAVLMFYGNNGILLEYSEQTSISHLTRERLLRMPVPNPPRTEQQGIADTLDCIEFVLIQSQEEQDRLESLKHSVADGLLTGNLRISLPSVSTQCGLSDV